MFAAAADVRSGQSAEHLARERGHRNLRARRIDGAGPRIADVHAQDPGVLQRGRQRRERGRLLVLTEALEVGEEERLVLHQRSADRAAVLIAPQRRLGTVSRLEVGFGVQLRVAEELPRVAADLVRAAAVGDVDGRPGRAPVLGALVVGDDAELADRVGRRLHHLIGEPLVAGAVGVVVDAIDQEVVEGAAQAVDVERALARRAVRARALFSADCRTPVDNRASAEYSRPFSASSRICSPVIT